MENSNVIYYQQGDVLLFKTDKIISKDAVKTTEVHKGDNHEHKFKTKVKRDGNIFELEKENTLVHFEHGPITLPPGTYEKKIVLEYDHFTEEARQVID